MMLTLPLKFHKNPWQWEINSCAYKICVQTDWVICIYLLNLVCKGYKKKKKHSRYSKYRNLLTDYHKQTLQTLIIRNKIVFINNSFAYQQCLFNKFNWIFDKALFNSIKFTILYISFNMLNITDFQE